MPPPPFKQPIWTAIGEGNLLLGVTGVLPCPLRSPMSGFFVEFSQVLYSRLACALPVWFTRCFRCPLPQPE